MGWYIHHVNLPATNVPKTRAFLRDVIGFKLGQWTYPASQGELHHDENSIAFFGSGNRGIHAVRPIPTFAVDNGFVHNPTIGGHFALTVPDLKPVMQRFDEAGVVYSDAGIYAMAGVQQIYAYDPSMYLIEINQLHDGSGGAPPPGEDEQHGIWMEAGDWYIHHVNLPAHDVRATVAFSVIWSASKRACGLIRKRPVSSTGHRMRWLISAAITAASISSGRTQHSRRKTVSSTTRRSAATRRSPSRISAR